MDESFLASSYFLLETVNLCHNRAYRWCITLNSVSVVTWHSLSLCVSVFQFSLQVHEFHASGLQCQNKIHFNDPIQLVYICKHFISKQGHIHHIHRYQRLGHQHLLGEHNSTPGIMQGQMSSQCYRSHLRHTVSRT